DEHGLVEEAAIAQLLHEVAQVAVDVMHAVEIALVLSVEAGEMLHRVTGRHSEGSMAYIGHDSEEEWALVRDPAVQPAPDRRQERPILPAERGDETARRLGNRLLRDHLIETQSPY